MITRFVSVSMPEGKPPWWLSVHCPCWILMPDELVSLAAEVAGGCHPRLAQIHVGDSALPCSCVEVPVAERVRGLWARGPSMAMFVVEVVWGLVER